MQVFAPRSFPAISNAIAYVQTTPKFYFRIYILDNSKGTTHTQYKGRIHPGQWEGERTRDAALEGQGSPARMRYNKHAHILFFPYPQGFSFLFLSLIPFCVHFCTFALECLPGLGFVFRGTPRGCARAHPEGASRESERPNSARRGGEGSIPPSLCGIVVELLNKVHCTA